VQLPPMSIIIPIIVTIVLVFLMLVITMFVMRSVMRTSVAMKELSELNFENATLKEKSRFKEVQEIQDSFTKLKAATLALTKYVSPLVVKQLLKKRNEEGAAVEMDLAHLSIMFVDMIGWKDNMLLTTGRSRSANFTEILSKWFAVVGSVVSRNRGMIDKFIEDCVMALFGAPEQYPENELDACRAALMLSRRFDAFKKRIGLKDVAQVQFRAGLHSGYVLVGNVGTADHINYTVCGMCANTASRMTELCGKYSLAPLITGDVYEHVKEHYLCAFIDVVLLRGHQFVHTRVYHLMCELERATPEEHRIAKSFSEIHRSVASGDKKRAKAVIERLLNASWSGKYLTALRLLRSRIISRALTRKMYGMTTTPPNDLSTKSLHYTGDDTSHSSSTATDNFGPNRPQLTREHKSMFIPFRRRSLDKITTRRRSMEHSRDLTSDKTFAPETPLARESNMVDSDSDTFTSEACIVDVIPPPKS